jgi:hypothetical protein
MKTTTTSPRRIPLPEDNLWQWADQKRAMRFRQEVAPESLSRRMAKGILIRLYSLLGVGGR